MTKIETFKSYVQLSIIAFFIAAFITAVICQVRVYNFAEAEEAVMPLRLLISFFIGAAVGSSIVLGFTQLVISHKKK